MKLEERSKFKVGEAASISHPISQEEINSYAELLGDKNPIHINLEYAQTTRFKNRIAHGMFVAGLISRVLGTKLPGPGGIYLSQELYFKLPVYAGDTLRAQAVVTAWDAERGIITLDTVVVNQDSLSVVEGKAKLIMSGFLSD